MKTLIAVLGLATDYLEQHAIPNPRRQAEEIICEALHIKRIDLYLQYDKPLSENEILLCRERIQRRASHEPAAYISGQVEFNGCTIHVTPDVLIPRPETEILATMVCQELKNHPHKTLLDLCTGSGCLGISIKKQVPNLNVILSDISEKAVQIARQNAINNHVQVEVRVGNLLEPFQNQKVDFVVCNPPYIRETDYQILSSEVKKEPKTALVGGLDGLDFYRQLATELPAHLNPGGKVWLEIGYDQGDDVKNIFKSPPWTRPHLQNDWAGMNRFFSLEIE